MASSLDMKISSKIINDNNAMRVYGRWITKIDFTKKCWNWNASKDQHGYGKLSSKRGKSPFKAHRLSLFFKNGEMPNGHVLHLCDNPSCVNPDHLMIGTQKENMMQASKRNRLNKNSLLNLRPGEKGFRGAGSKSLKQIEREKDNGKFTK